MEEGKKILSILEVMNTRFDGIDKRLDKIDAHLGIIDARLDKVESRLGKVESRLDKVESRLDKVESRLGKVESDIKDIKMTIENEIKPAISIIAEGHLNLDRKLENIIKMNENRLSEHEIMKLKINHLDSEVLKLNEKIMTSA
ncbi:MAG: hypothetical protein IJ591_06115 [Lachnospiraceae bacterium]|nr:hypothetical protein [Lachnospiraceae bacterium]